MTAEVSDNAAWAGAVPVLSVLTPFMRDDPRPLLAALEAEAARLNGRAELILLDDGGGDQALATAVREALAGMTLPARLVQLTVNEGRAKGRNRLAGHARADRFLFLDSDMLPDSPDFLTRYLDMIAAGDPAVVFGGFSTLQAPPHARHALHRQMAQSSDCLAAEVRQKTPEKYIYTSNLLVRRDVFEGEAFDEAFTGWGWEDVEWGMRVGARWPIIHADNPATHLGLDTAAALMGKYRQSTANFARLVRLHPQIVAAYPSYKVARILKRAPLRSLWRPLLGGVALAEGLPAKVRALSLRLYRCALYAEAV